VRRPFDYSKHSPVHRRGQNLRVIKRIGKLFRLFGWLLVLIHPVFLGLAFFNDFPERGRFLWLAGIYFSSGLGFLFVGWAAIALNRRARHRRHRGQMFAGDSGNNIPDIDLKQESRGKSRDDGAVLVLVLIMLALVAGLVGQAQVAARSRFQQQAAAVNITILRQSATDAVRDALQRIANDDPAFDSREEAWAQTVESVDPLGVTVRVELEDENRYFDLNNLALGRNATVRPPAAVLLDILNLCGHFDAAGKVEALSDWIDADQEGFRESGFYTRMKRPYAAADRLLYGWNELLLNDGWDRSMFERRTRRPADKPFRGSLVDAVTIVPYPRQRIVPVNVNTAGEETLLGVLGLENEALLYRILARRKESPIQELDMVGLAVDPDLVARVGPYLSVQSAFFRIYADAVRQDHTERVQALAYRNAEGAVEVLQWVY